jgi:pyruvate/2-oxoacid:ferredoxin oxidoreductase alpha subunit
MVCYDGFVLSHTMMPVEIPEAAQVKNFLPPYRPHTFLDPERPRTINPVFFPWRRENAEGVLCDGYMEMRYKLQRDFDTSLEVIEDVNVQYTDLFGRNYGGLIWEYQTGDADIFVTGMGSIAQEATLAVDALREEGIKIGVVGIRSFRPFPKEKLIHAFSRARIIIVFQKAISYGNEGGLSTEVKAALYGSGIDAPVHDYIAGLGGRDVKTRELIAAIRDTLERSGGGDCKNKTTWLNCHRG